MTKLYYPSPLASAWMETHHGMKFNGFFISEESMPLLQARKGDLVLLANGMEAYRYSTAARLDKGERIVERDGKAFFWPDTHTAESE
jgi:hypothetical protein